jgi:hypothetical protein
MANKVLTKVIVPDLSDSDPDEREDTRTQTLASTPIISVTALFEDAGLAGWSLFGAAIGVVLETLMLRALSIGI